MLKKLCFSAAFMLLFSTFCNAQTTKEHHPESYIQLSGLSDQQKLKELVSINQGTYQLIVSNEDYAPLLNLDLFETISIERQQSSNALIEIDEFTQVFIPSQDAIENEHFVALETIVYNTNPNAIGTSE